MRRLSPVLLAGLIGPVLMAAAPVPPAPGAGAEQVEAALARIKATMLVDPQAAGEQGAHVASLAAAIPDADTRSRLLATVDWLRGEANLRLNRLDAATPLIGRGLMEVRRIAPGSKLNGDLLLSQGGLDQARADVAGALVAYQRAFAIFRTLGDTRSQSIALLSLAALYYDANENLSALRYFERALDTYDADSQLAISNHNTRGLILTDLGRYPEAQAQLNAALALSRQLNSPMLRAGILSNLARSYLKQQRLPDAERALAAAMKLVRGDPAALQQTMLVAVAAQAALQRHDLADATRLTRDSFKGVDLALTPTWYRDAHRTAFDVFTAAGDPAEALPHLAALKRIDGEAAKLATSLNTALVAARFDFASQELRIAKLKADELRRNVEIAREEARYERIIFGAVAAATLVIIGLLVTGLFAIRRSRNEVRAANAGLADSNAALARALAAKTEFLATTSHEIRTPLNGILGMTQVMLADAGLPDAVRDRIGLVHGAGTTMRALVDDILDMAKIETGNLTVETAPFNCCKLIGDACRLWQDQARAKALTFAIDLDDCPAMIEGDAARVRQIVFNLLSNAIKFTQAGGIRVSTASTRDGATYQVRVGDSGIGISPEQVEAIFESFRQADAGTTRRFGGTGLGLAICRNLARAMGGEVTVESVVGEGSIFVLTLPLRTAADVPLAPRDASARRLLVVEANPITRGTLRTLAERYGADVVAVGGAAEGAERLDAGGITHVLVDDGALGPDAAAALDRLAGVAHRHGAEVVLLWSGETPVPTAADRVVAKPVAGRALMLALFIDDPTNATNGGAGPLVSRAA